MVRVMVAKRADGELITMKTMVVIIMLIRGLMNLLGRHRMIFESYWKRGGGGEGVRNIVSDGSNRIRRKGGWIDLNLGISIRAEEIVKPLVQIQSIQARS